MDNRIMAGIVAKASFPISHGVLGIIITDKTHRITKGFYVSPVKHSALTEGYILCAFTVSAFTVSTFITIATFALAQGYILLNGGAVLLRQIIMETVMEDTFAGMPWQVRQGICENFGVTYYFSYFKATPNPLSEISSLYFPLHVPSTFLRIHACILPNPSPHIECSGARSSGSARLHF